MDCRIASDLKSDPLQIETAVKRNYSDAEKSEYSREIQEAICPNSSVSLARQRETYYLAMFLRGCASWKCPVCGPKKKRKLVAKILRANPQRFLTLTVQAPTDENGLTWTPREAFDSTRRKCARLFQEMRRETGKKTEYVRVLEQTKRGYPHYHFLTKGPFWPVASIVAKWQRLTGSYIVDIQKPKAAKQTIGYVAKYVAKSNEVDFTERRISASRNFYQRCKHCKKTDCVCGKDNWFDWNLKRGHWQDEVEQLAKRFAFTDGPGTTVFWLDTRTEGEEIPDRLSRYFLCNQPQDEEEQC